MKFNHQYFIQAPVSEVYKRLYEIEKWPDLLPHVEEIKPIVINDKEQRVIMTIRNSNGTESIETVRTFEKDKYITFNQPKPPKPLSVHNGIWVLEKLNNGTLVKSIHEIDNNTHIISRIVSLIAWNLFIKKNSLLTLRSIKLDLEYSNHSITKIIKNSCFVNHSIDINLSVNEAFETIGNPELWPILFPTAINVKVLKREPNLIEFELNEYVGKNVFPSHIHFHLDKEKKAIYYQHYPPTFPVKYMVIRWIFKDLGDNRCRFSILREYDIRIPIIGKLLAKTVAKRVIKQHVDDYHNDLRGFVKSVNVFKWAKKSNWL